MKNDNKGIFTPGMLVRVTELGKGIDSEEEYEERRYKYLHLEGEVVAVEEYTLRPFTYDCVYVKFGYECGGKIVADIPCEYIVLFGADEIEPIERYSFGTILYRHFDYHDVDRSKYSPLHIKRGQICQVEGCTRIATQVGYVNCLGSILELFMCDRCHSYYNLEWVEDLSAVTDLDGEVKESRALEPALV